MIVFINQLAHNIFQQFRILTKFFLKKCNLHWNCPGITFFLPFFFFSFGLKFLLPISINHIRHYWRTFDSIFHHGFNIFSSINAFSIHVAFVYIFSTKLLKTEFVSKS
jgi:hypothetical protein